MAEIIDLDEAREDLRAAAEFAGRLANIDALEHIAASGVPARSLSIAEVFDEMSALCRTVQRPRLTLVSDRSNG